MTIKYQSYWASVKKIQREATLVGRLDISNGTTYKKLLENGEISAAEIAERNHRDGLHYEFSAFRDIESPFPYCYVTIVHKNQHAGVNFIDDAGRNYLTYLFREINSERTLFLREVWYHRFISETADEESYRLHFVFDQEGNIAVRKYDEIRQKAVDFESRHPFDPRDLYEPYPEFGRYEGLIRLERNLPFDSGPGAPPSHPRNKWLPPDWFN